ncbi:uncharacterized protein K02A2.6-like [Stylophora pistillata]|uniref:uncharacterized protein K02A2.6-like n=1 Tax=Stylophora pistillata TaxID=50429 RepID=UPI000C039F83|nr:uncharacterized protein K02A2.6-like [Stylophora pistillata]
MNETCRKCGKLGHIQRVCRSGRNQNTTRRRKVDKPKLHYFEMNDERDDDSFVASLEVNNVNQRYKEMFADTPLVYTKAILKSYSGEKMKPEGKLLVRVEHNNQVKNFTLRKDELTLQDGCLLWGSRVIIPPKYRTQLLEQLHEGHPGIVRMKALARSYIWWPGMDKEVEQTAKGCTGCQLTQKNPKTAPLHTWEWPARPWQRIHIDFSGPFLGTMFLIVVDSHSKWPEVIAMTTTNAARTIEELRKLFATNGLPEQLVSHNGPQFTSDEFRTFMRNNGIKHRRSAP